MDEPDPVGQRASRDVHQPEAELTVDLLVQSLECERVLVADPSRLVAIDLDGTVLRSDGTISPRTAAALARIDRAGARFVIVTGRRPRHTVAALGPSTAR